MKIAAFYENIKLGAEAARVSLRDALLELKHAGMDMIYISWEEYRKDPDGLSSLFREAQLQVEGLHQWVDFAHDPDTEIYKCVIGDAKALGAGNVLFVPGFVFPGEEEKAEEILENMITAMGRAAAYGKEVGIKVCMEDFDGITAPYNSIAGLKLFLDQIPELHVCFDTGNFIMYHEDELEAFGQFRSRICAMHLKDRSKTPHFPKDQPKLCADGTPEYPCPVGAGYIRMEEILRQLKAQQYPGNLIVELYDCDPEHILAGIRQSVSWVRQRL